MRLDVILRVATKLLLPLMLVFALYVQFHGDYGPGGGFQAGVIAAGAVILHGLVYGLERTRRILPLALVEALVPTGVLIYGGVGIAGLLTGGNYLDYSRLAADPAHGQEWGVFLVEAGVFVTVFATMLAIFYAFADRGRSGR
jgi:multicomponent Na+:H+ antiporter subunit B